MPLRSRVETVGVSFPAEDGTAFGVAVQQLLRGLGHAPRLLGFGEAMHGEDAFLRMRNQLFQHLVEHAGYRSIAIESSWLKGRQVDAFIQGGTGSLYQVMRQGFSHGFGASPANRHLVEWMVEYNQSRPDDQRLRFFGFDVPTEMMSADSPREALSLAFTFLESHLDPDDLLCSWETINSLIGDDGRWTDPAAAMDPSRSVGSSPDVDQLRLITDELLLASESPRLIASSSRDSLWEAELSARTAAALLLFHAAMASRSPRRVARLLSIRDTLMAYALCALADREARRGPTLVFAHNQHLHKGESHWQLGDQVLRWHCAGALLAVRLQDDYAVIGSAIGAAPHHGIAEPDPETLEGQLYALPLSAHLLPTAPLTTAVDGARPSLSRRPKVATSPTSHTYFSLDPTALGQFDAVLFLHDISDGHPETHE